MYLGALGYVQKQRAGGDLMPAIEAALKGSRFVSSGLQVGQGADGQAQSRHEILFYSDNAALLDGLAHFVVNALNSGNAAIVRATISRLESLDQELRARGIDIEAAIRRGIYLFLDVDEPPDRARIPDAVRRLSEAASKAGKKDPCVAVYSERTGRLWAEGKTHEAIQLEQRANELAKRHNVDILCPYALPRGQEDHSAFKSVCTQHSAVSFR